MSNQQSNSEIKLSPEDIQKLLVKKAQEMYPDGFDIVYGDGNSIMVTPKLKKEN